MRQKICDSAFSAVFQDLLWRYGYAACASRGIVPDQSELAALNTVEHSFTEDNFTDLKVVVVGDGGYGIKTPLIHKLIDWEPPIDDPTVAANYSIDWEWDVESYPHQEWDVELWDSTNHEALRSLRALSYPDTNVFLLAYDMTDATSLNNIPGWCDEIEDNYYDYHGMVLVGCNYDKWLELKGAGQDTELVTVEQAEEVHTVLPVWCALNELVACRSQRRSVRLSVFAQRQRPALVSPRVCVM